MLILIKPKYTKHGEETTPPHKQLYKQTCPNRKILESKCQLCLHHKENWKHNLENQLDNGFQRDKLMIPNHHGWSSWSSLRMWYPTQVRIHFVAGQGKKSLTLPPNELILESMKILGYHDFDYKK